MEINYRPIPAMPPETVLRFWSKVAMRLSNPNACWNWISIFNADGYGRFIYKKTEYRSNRVAAVLSGVEGEGPIVMHSCDNPACCNPRHLRFGTFGDNNFDSINKMRRVVHPAKGAAHYAAKLTEEDVRAIRKEREAGVSLRTLCNRYKVSSASISFIVSRQRWRHVV